MSLILALETATEVSSVAVTENGQIKASLQIRNHKSHSRFLAKMVEDILYYLGIKTTDLSAVAISSGPGSYTGLRIGTSLAKGLCFGNDIPLISVNTLEGMAHSISNKVLKDGVIIPMIDARRMEVYCATFDKDLALAAPTTNKIIDQDSFSAYSNTQVYFTGNGVSKCVELLRHNQNFVFIEEPAVSAESIGVLASKKFENQEYEDLALFEPFYLKEYKAGKPKKTVLG